MQKTKQASSGSAVFSTKPDALHENFSGWLRVRPKYTGHWSNRYFVCSSEGMLYAFSYDPKASSEKARSLPVNAYHLGRKIVISPPTEKMVRTSRQSTKKEKVYALAVSLASGGEVLFTVGASTMESANTWKKIFEDASKIITEPIPFQVEENVHDQETSNQIAPLNVRSRGASMAAAGGGNDDSNRKSLLPDLWGGNDEDNWHVVEVQEGLEIEGEKVTSGKFPMLRAKATINSSADALFDLILDDARRTLWDTGVQNSQMLKEISPNTHVVYLQTRGFWIGPVYTGARDLVLLRYWRKDGKNYVITWQSIEDASSPMKDGFVRGKIFSMGFSISYVNASTSTIRVSCHADPGGTFSYMPINVLQKWLYPFVTRVLGLQKALNASKGELVVEKSFTEDGEILDEKNMNESPAMSPQQRMPSSGEEVNTLKLGTWNHKEWLQTPYEATFNVRGKTYLTDGIKIKTGEQKFHLVAADLNKTDEPIPHCAARSDSPLKAIQKAYPDRQVFIINFIMPGPPYYLLSFYSVNKPGVLDDDSPFARLWSSFVEGDDEYRNSVLKMIPRVPHGAFVVKKTVGETPAIMGRKIKTYYYISKNYVEVDFDLNTSAVAGSILSIFKGYATTLVADLCILFEGHSEDELPEVILTSFRMSHPHLGKAVPLGKDPNPQETQRMRDLVEKHVADGEDE